MPFRIFISHSVLGVDYPLVQSLANLAWANGMQVFVPDWYSSRRDRVTKQVTAQIDSSDTILALITSSTARLTRVAQEVAYAVGKGKEVIGLVENGINAEDVLLSGKVPVAHFDRTDFHAMAESVLDELKDKARTDSNRNVLAGVLIGGLILWALSQRGQDSNA